MRRVSGIGSGGVGSSSTSKTCDFPRKYAQRMTKRCRGAR